LVGLVPEFIRAFFIKVFTISTNHISYLYNMRAILILCLIIGCTSAFSQNDALANEYYKNGDFEKALLEYKKLYAQSPSNINYINQIVSTHQQLEQYNESETFLLSLLERLNYPAFLVDLGYNYQL